MAWAVVAVAALLLAVVYPRFRRVLAALAGLALLAALGLLAWLYYQEQAQLREREAAKSRIPIGQIEPFDMTMGIDGPMVTLRGRVRNNDETHTLTAIELRLRVVDCRKDATKPGPGGIEDFQPCDIVGEAIEDISVSVPPRQVREFDEYVLFPGLGTSTPDRMWNYEVLSVSGQ